MPTTVNSEVAGTGDFNVTTVTVNTGISGGGGSTTTDTSVDVIIPFSGAVTDSLIWDGPGRIYQVVLTTGAVGSIVIEDQNNALPAPTALATLTTTTSPETFTVNELVSVGVCLTITGANTGYVIMQES